MIKKWKNYYANSSIVFRINYIGIISYRNFISIFNNALSLKGDIMLPQRLSKKEFQKYVKAFTTLKSYWKNKDNWYLETETHIYDYHNVPHIPKSPVETDEVIGYEYMCGKSINKKALEQFVRGD